jgi:hypothetical protein
MSGENMEKPIPSTQVRTHSDFLNEVYDECFPEETTFGFLAKLESVSNSLSQVWRSVSLLWRS